MKVNKLGITILSSGIATDNYIFNGRIAIKNEIIYSRRINRSIFGIYIGKNEKLS